MPVEIAADALVLAEEDLLVHLLEVERVVQRAAHAGILELGAAQVRHEGLHDARAAVGELLQDHALLGHGREIVGASPSSWRCSRCASRPGRP